MNLLSIDTTSAIASVAVRSADGHTHQMHSEEKMSHLRNLIPMIDSLLLKCGLEIGDISYIALSEGPGSFTGIRIGAATAKMLAQARQIDLIPVPTLAAYACGAKDFDGLVCPMLDARRSQVYAAAYLWRGGRCVQVLPGAAYGLEEFLSLIYDDMEIHPATRRSDAPESGNPLLLRGERVLYIGDGAKAYQKEIEDNAARLSCRRTCKNSESRDDHIICSAEDHHSVCRTFFRDEIGSQGLAGFVLDIAAERLREGQTVSPFDFMPVYMRQAEAIRKLHSACTEEKRNKV